MTKDRSTAVIRNLKISALIKEMILVEKQANRHFPKPFRHFKEHLESAIFEVRTNEFKTSDYEIASIGSKKTTQVVQKEIAHGTPLPSNVAKQTTSTMIGDALELFIKGKESGKVTKLTVHQLNQRISHFVSFVGGKRTPLQNISSRNLALYVEKLDSSGKSPKTSKDYFSATKQFLKWCTAMEYIPSNPSEKIEAKFRSTKHASEERQRWTSKELRNLFSSTLYRRSSEDFKWVTLLMLYQGLRPSEACQLKTSDIKIESGNMVYVDVTDKGELQRVKNQNAVRKVPLHHHLIELGFLKFVHQKRQRRSPTLFNYKPSKPDYDWSKGYRNQLGKMLTHLGFKAYQRPTAYSFRHSFIDELKNLGIAEHFVAEIVGHANSNITYGRYGKPIDLAKRGEIINQLPVFV
ncbi:site-specific integrase [Vibrio sp. SCSIO 43137]|uniref:site-specific integrase n=1 Tax=Vibrio sp. SCSIO 43137 TaxID=3021011 RepID=UPI002307B1F7|nr:site-specific integrase [Vibrio sp. SCSIO 43137]WCE28787.1 site-specific integrase [Vibrio sp. SCSIO 43137]